MSGRSAEALLLSLAGTALFACGVAVDPAPADGGLGGSTTSESSTTSFASSSSRSSSSSGNLADAGVDGDGGCPSCGAVLGSTHDPGRFCAGSEAFAAWTAYVNCGCTAAGACASDCLGGGWCKGQFPIFTGWVEPAGSCGKCLAEGGPTGCGDQRALCWKE